MPCDLKLDSNAVEDACGVCHGDGTSCQLHEGERFIPGNATAGKKGSNKSMTFTLASKYVSNAQGERFPRFVVPSLRAFRKGSVVRAVQGFGEHKGGGDYALRSAHPGDLRKGDDYVHRRVCMKVCLRNLVNLVTANCRSAVGMYNVPGSKAWLGMIRTNQEALEIPGPVGAKLEVWVCVPK